MSSVQSVIDHYPLSAYVDWAAKRNRDPILDVFSSTSFHRLATLSNSRAAAARISTISRRIFRTSGFNPPITIKVCSKRSGKCKPSRQCQCLGPRPHRPRQAGDLAGRQDKSLRCCLRNQPVSCRAHRYCGKRGANRRAGLESNRLPGDLGRSKSMGITRRHPTRLSIESCALRMLRNGD